jgi:hypothetical protein
MKEVLEDQNDVILGCNKTKPQMESSFTSPSKIEIKIINSKLFDNVVATHPTGTS